MSASENEVNGAASAASTASTASGVAIDGNEASDDCRLKAVTVISGRSSGGGDCIGGASPFRVGGEAETGAAAAAADDEDDSAGINTLEALSEGSSEGRSSGGGGDGEGEA